MAVQVNGPVPAMPSRLGVFLGAPKPLSPKVSKFNPVVWPAGWQLVAGLAAAVLLALGVGLLIARAAGFSEVRDAIELADSKWFVVCLVAQGGALVAYA